MKIGANLQLTQHVTRAAVNLANDSAINIIVWAHRQTHIHKHTNTHIYLDATVVDIGDHNAFNCASKPWPQLVFDSYTHTHTCRYWNKTDYTHTHAHIIKHIPQWRSSG